MKRLISAVILSSIVVSVRSATEAHYCEAMEANDYKIDYFFNFPHYVFDFTNIFVIRGILWYTLYNETTSTSIEDKTGFAYLKNEYGYRWKGDFDNFFARVYKSGLVVKYPGDNQLVILSGLSDNYEEIIYVLTSPLGEKNRAIRLRANGDNDSYSSIETGFNKINYKPQVSFNTFANIERNIIYFIESKPENGSFKSDIRSFSIPDPNIKKEITETFDDVNKLSESIVEVSKKYRIVGVFPIKLTKSKTAATGYIFIIDFCDSADFPCTGTQSYKYCVVEIQAIGVTDEGKPCHRSQLRLLFDCTSWDSREEEEETTLSPIMVTSSPTAEATIVMTEEAMTSTSTMQTTTDRPTDRTAAKPEESGFSWLLILLLIPLIIAIILIILCLVCCRKRKGKDSSVKDVPTVINEEGAAEGGLGNTKSSLSTASTRSGVDGQPPKTGLAAASSLSTTSNRSGVDGQVPNSGVKASSSLSTASTRSGVNNPKQSSSVGQGADIP